MITRRALASVLLALRRSKIDEALALLDRAMENGVRLTALFVRQGKQTFARNADVPFLLASISKPVTCTGVMILAHRKQLALADPVTKYIPEFTGGDRGLVTIHNLVTHTSGLPDMLPENEALRKRHAPLSEFVAGACKTPLLFKPGTQVKYQSMGILLAAEIVQRITKERFKAFLDRELFTPLAMKQTELGLDRIRFRDTARCDVEADPEWNWNSMYWRTLASPWGGVHGSAEDVARFLDFFLHPDDKIVPAATKRRMVTNQFAGLNDQWGIGWVIGRGKFARACSDSAFGHSGSTGTLAWADPKSDTVCVILTTKPADQSRRTLIDPVSNLIADAAL